MSEAFEKFSRLLDSGVRNLSQSFYDKYVEVNAKFRAKAGLKVTIVREALGECCSWCSDLAGTYSYENAPDDIYARHRDCNCVVSTKTEKGTWQDAWSRKEYKTFRENRIAREREIDEEQRKKKRLNAEYLKRNQDNNQGFNRARRFKSVEETRSVSGSEVLGLSSHQEVVQYFRDKYSISVQNFEKHSLESIKITLSGADDLLIKFPEASAEINNIVYNSNIKVMGRYIPDTKSILIGKQGIQDYGTGVHEVAHALDKARSEIGTNSYSERIVRQAKKNLKLRNNTKKTINLEFQITGRLNEPTYELFAYATETHMSGVENSLATEIFRLMGEDY